MNMSAGYHGSCGEYHEYIGGYHDSCGGIYEYIGGRSVHRGDHEYVGGIS